MVGTGNHQVIITLTQVQVQEWSTTSHRLYGTERAELVAVSSVSMQFAATAHPETIIQEKHMNCTSQMF